MGKSVQNARNIQSKVHIITFQRSNKFLSRFHCFSCVYKHMMSWKKQISAKEELTVLTLFNSIFSIFLLRILCATIFITTISLILEVIKLKND